MDKKQVWKTEKEKELDPVILEYCSGEDLELDKNLIKYDIQVNKAHAKMLAKVGLISNEECEKILKALDEMPEGFELKKELEDVHMNIEAALGEIGKKLHTAKSRNDQVMTDMHLLMKDKLGEIAESVKGFQLVLKEKAGEYLRVTRKDIINLRKRKAGNYAISRTTTFSIYPEGYDRC